MSELKAGIAQANITPPVGMLMAGYGARKMPAVGIHDELHAVALYVTDGQTEAALVTADLLSIDAQGTARVRKACAEKAGLSEGNILVACSHTHGGPQTELHRGGSGDALREVYSTVVVHKAAGALAEAKRNAVPVSVGFGRQGCSFAMNRRERLEDGTIILGVNRAGPTDPFARVIRLDRLDAGEPLAVVLSYACHGTTLTDKNLLYTADYPGRAKRFVEQQFPKARAAFIAGCSGDNNPYPRGDYHQSERHGRELGCAAVQAALAIEEMVEGARVAVAGHQFGLQLEGPPSLDEARESLARAEAKAKSERAEARQAAGGEPVDDEQALSLATARALRSAREVVEALVSGKIVAAIPVEAQALAIGDCAIVGMPGEIFVKIGLEVAERSPFACTIPISHANGAIGYVPTADQVALGGYEVEMARASRQGRFIVPESDRAMIDGALAALRKCYDAIHG